MLYFTSDLHFYHENVIRFTNRPYRTVEEMNQKLIKNWNKIIKPQDEVYILGDLTMKGPELAMEILSQLVGVKHLIKGNHDKYIEKKSFVKELFASVADYGEVTYQNQKFILFHYPILEWDGYFRGTIMLHGHQHNHADYNLLNREKQILRYDVGVDANEMTPVSAEKIMAFFADTPRPKGRLHDNY